MQNYSHFGYKMKKIKLTSKFASYYIKKAHHSVCFFNHI